MVNYTLISLIALLALGAMAFVFGRSRRSDGSEEPIVVGEGDCATCTPETPKCEQICAMETATKPIEYFDDEELDIFKNRPADSYSDDEIEQFAYVLHTMQPDEVAAWTRSLTLRGIELPNELRDEVILLIGR